jgi:hypothetical protein
MQPREHAEAGLASCLIESVTLLRQRQQLVLAAVVAELSAVMALFFSLGSTCCMAISDSTALMLLLWSRCCWLWCCNTYRDADGGVQEIPVA